MTYTFVWIRETWISFWDRVTWMATKQKHMWHRLIRQTKTHEVNKTFSWYHPCTKYSFFSCHHNIILHNNPDQILAEQKRQFQQNNFVFFKFLTSWNSLGHLQSGFYHYSSFNNNSSSKRKQNCNCPFSPFLSLCKQTNKQMKNPIPPQGVSHEGLSSQSAALFQCLIDTDSQLLLWAVPAWSL